MKTSSSSHGLYGRSTLPRRRIQPKTYKRKRAEQQRQQDRLFLSQQQLLSSNNDDDESIEEEEEEEEDNVLRSGTKLQIISNSKTLKKFHKSKQRKLLKVVPDNLLHKK